MHVSTDNENINNCSFFICAVYLAWCYLCGVKIVAGTLHQTKCRLQNFNIWPAGDLVPTGVQQNVISPKHILTFKKSGLRHKAIIVY